MKIVDVDVLVKELQKAAAHKGLGAAIAGIILEYIETLPAIDAVPVVHGRWESIYRYNNGERAIGTCSVCKVTGELRTKRDEFCIWYIDSPCCPNCGAKMDGEANG